MPLSPGDTDADLPHSLVEISDREIAVTLEGPEATTLLTVGCPADVAGFDVSTGARTIFDGVQVVLYRDARTDLRWRSGVASCCTSSVC